VHSKLQTLRPRINVDWGNPSRSSKLHLRARKIAELRRRFNSHMCVYIDTHTNHVYMCIFTYTYACVTSISCFCYSATSLHRQSVTRRALGQEPPRDKPQCMLAGQCQGVKWWKVLGLRSNDAMQDVLRCGHERALHVNAGLCGSLEKIHLDDGVGRGWGMTAVLGMHMNTRYSSASSCPRACSTFRSSCMSHLLPSKTLFTDSDACCRADTTRK